MIDMRSPGRIVIEKSVLLIAFSVVGQAVQFEEITVAAVKSPFRKPKVKHIFADEGAVACVHDQGGLRIYGERKHIFGHKGGHDIRRALCCVGSDLLFWYGQQKGLIVFFSLRCSIAHADQHISLAGRLIHCRFVPDQRRSGQKAAEIKGGRGGVFAKAEVDITGI